MAIDRTKSQQKNALKAVARRVLTVVVVGILIVASMYVYNYLTTSESFAVHKVEFKGMSRVDASEIEGLLSDLKGQNILLVSLASYTDRIKAHPRVERVTINRVLPDRITCSVNEREPVALIFTDQFLEVDRHGMIMGRDEFSPLLDLPIITGLPKRSVEEGKISGDPQLRRALVALDLCKRYGGDFIENISEIRVSAAGLSIRSLEDNCVLLLGKSDYEKRLRKYFLLKDTLAENESSARLIDLRFDDQVVLRGQI